MLAVAVGEIIISLIGAGVVVEGVDWIVGGLV